jgi:RNA polymerase sigma-70 factor (ECF subfamily)
VAEAHTHSVSRVEFGEYLAASRHEFLRFVRARISDPELAEDVLQDALVRAVQSLDTVRDDERLVAWFYRILRNAIVDAYRRRDVRRRRESELDPALDLPEELDAALEQTLCACFQELLPALKAEYAEVLQAVDLGEESPEVVAVRLGITPNNLKVRRHRARAALRQQLEATCRVCSSHGCTDCTCQEEGRV